MKTLNKQLIESLPIQASTLSRVATRLTEEEGQANPSVFFLLPLIILGLALVVGGFAESNFSLGATGVVILGVILGSAVLLERISLRYLETRWNRVKEYLDLQDHQAVVSQAVGLGPDYLGRQCLFAYLDEAIPGWAHHHTFALGKLAASFELPGRHRRLVADYLNRNHPGWSMKIDSAAPSLPPPSNA